MTRLVEQYERQVIKLLERIEQINNRPQEPEYENEPTVIRYDLKFNGGRFYSYAAIRIGEFWYTTGPSGDGRQTWDELMAFIEHKLVGDIWLVTAYEALPTKEA